MSLSQMAGGTDDETTPMIDAVMDDIVTATRDGVFQEQRNESSSDTVGNNMFGRPRFEKGEEQAGEDDDGRGRARYRDVQTERPWVNHERSQSFGRGAAGEPGTSGLKDRHSSQMPPHRYLFHCYVYQYNLIQMGSIIIEMVSLPRLFFTL